MLYLTEMYFKIHKYGELGLYALVAIVVLGGLALICTMADNGKKGSLDFSREYMSVRIEEYATVIRIWKKALSVLVIVAILAVLAPSREVVTGWSTAAVASGNK